MKDTIARVMFAGVFVLGMLQAAAAVAVDGVTITPLLRQRKVTCMLEADGVVYAGLDYGGLVRWPADAPDQPRVWTAGAGELGGNRITSLSWSGRNLWVGTAGSGLTRITDPAGAAGFRQYASSEAALNVSAVDAVVVGDAERVWYGTANAGVGLITNGLAIAHYTAEGDGLLSNAVKAVAITADAVYFGTGIGVSRFAGNAFTTVNAGLTDLDIRGLAVAPDGTLTAVGRGGVYTFDPGTETWTLLGKPSYQPAGMTWVGTDLYVFIGGGQVSRWTGSAFVNIATPYAETGGIAGGDALWAGGRWNPGGMSPAVGFAWYARLGAGDVWESRVLDGGPVVGSPEGLTFGADGRAWIGSWAGAGFSGLKDGQWINVDSLATDANDSSGLINFSGNLLAMATDRDGAVWATQFNSGGLLRRDAVTGRTEQILTTNSGLSGRRIVGLTVHPDGPLLMAHDAGDVVAMQVLIDPAHWRNPANWIDPAAGGGGIGQSVQAWDFYVERPDVIWIAVQSAQGLYRWDVNGDDAGPDDPLTWADLSDDRWDGPIATFNNPDLDIAVTFKDTRALSPGPDGGIWVGGDYLVLFTPTVTPTSVFCTAQATVLVKQVPEAPGILGGKLNDLATDTAGDLWLVTETGLNRVRLYPQDHGYRTEVDTWLDLANYVTGVGYSTLYSTQVLDALPGLVYRRVVADPDSPRLLVSSDQGAALVTVAASGAETGGAAVAGTYLYPNPWHPDSDPRLAIGNLGATADDPADVTIYNIEGQIVYRDPYVAGNDAFWSGINRVGSDVASGVYVVKIAWRGGTVMRTLALVR